MLTKRKILLLFLLLVILSLGILNWPIENAVSSQKKADTRCDYSTACEFTTKQGVFWLTVDNPPIKAEQWISLSLQSELSDWQVKEANIVGRDMFMGRIPVQFKANEKGKFSAQTMVGACTRDEMIWQLQIEVELQGKIEMLSYDFAVYH